MRLFDTHCHLQNPGLGGQLSDLLDEARRLGVSRFLCCGTWEGDWMEVLRQAGCEAGVQPALGLHPWFVREAEVGWLARLETLLRDHPGAALGECGLDFATDVARGAQGPERPLQLAAFRGQWELALRLNRPLSIHCREAWEPLLGLARELGMPSAGAVIHAFSGSVETAQALQKLSFCLGFGASLTKPGHRRAAAALVSLNADHLVLETDASRTPMELLQVLESASHLRGVAPAVLAEQVWHNSLRVFDPSGFRSQGQAEPEA